MRKFLMTQLPEWARPSHPILQYELSDHKPIKSRLTRFIQILIITFLLGLGGYLYASIIYDSPDKGILTDLVWRSLYFPTLVLQVITSILALSFGIHSVGQKRSNRTWDKLRATEVGAELTLRTRWVSILYRLRAPIMALLLVRLVLLIGLLYDIITDGNTYPDMLTQNITPLVNNASIGLVMLVFNIVASMLLPITMIGASVGLGILISVSIKNRDIRLLFKLLL
jgi:hypothetical protein